MRSTDAGNIALEDNMLHLRRTYLERKKRKNKNEGGERFQNPILLFFSRISLLEWKYWYFSISFFFPTLTKNRVDRMVLLSRIGGIL